MPSTPEPIQKATLEEKQRLTQLALHVHNTVRMLKVGDTTVLPVGTFNSQEVKMYLWAYALHKGKWFELEYDATAKVFHVKRAPGLPEPDDEFDVEEEL